MFYRSRRQTLRRALSSAKEGLFGVMIRAVVRCVFDSIFVLTLQRLSHVDADNGSCSDVGFGYIDCVDQVKFSRTVCTYVQLF